MKRESEEESEEEEEDSKEEEEDSEDEIDINYGLVYACQGGEIGIARRMLEMNADVNFFNNDEYYADGLHYAAEDGRTDIVKLLIEYNADVNAL